MNEEEVEEDDNNEEENDNNDNAKQDDEQHKKMKGHESRGDKGSKNSNSIASLLAEICRAAEEHIPERSPVVDPYQGSFDKTAKK